ncbi:hypothetical protein B0T16DRAFT_456638 [Cercophora newfieldiana]|uniref:Uncharacterized protein n=1 Tax=Cercophora newfieldiana TaxID=92897 RepID=A0AA40CSN4_9PEZI|nr:hypothetical protein B0T16DRAFT_456638 [Cercophora newfieldiana]
MIQQHHLFALCLALSSSAAAQSFAGGDLSNSPGPYGIPPDQVFDAAQVPNSYLTVPINGYNTSIPAGPAIGTADTLPGWTLAIGVSANVPLAGADAPGVDAHSFMQMTALSVTPPAELDTPDYKEGDWRVCAIVFTGGLLKGVNGTGTGRGTADDGGCGGWLPQGCIGQLQARSVAVAGNASVGGCVGMEVPEVCKGYFGEGKGVAYEVSPSDDGNARIFFAAGSAPFTHRGNQTLLAAAEDAVWPLVLTWSHLGQSGAVHDSQGWLSCVRSGGGDAPSAGSRALVGGSIWALLMAGAVMLVL